MKITRHHKDIQLPISACALGMFDGVHVGHRMVLENAVREARILSEAKSQHVPSVVFSFAEHPQQLLAKTPTCLLSSLEERLEQFESLGFDHALILDFNPWLRSLSPQDFVQDILVKSLGAQHVSVGYDYRFGKDKAGNGDVLTSLGAEYGFGVTVIEPVKRIENAQIASSTLIRKLLTYGDIQVANQLLGRPYQLTGMVEKGFQRGRQLGFPTANISVSQQRIIPSMGTYGGVAILKGNTTAPEQTYAAVCNIGLSPTFKDESPVNRVEVHLLDYAGEDFYNQPLTFQFYERLRDEQSFGSVQDLIGQIQRDCDYVKRQAYLNQHQQNDFQRFKEPGYSI